jgi:hypothetical protein
MESRAIPTAVLYGLSAAGGIFFGLFSCGRYVWHWHWFLAVFAVAGLLVLVVPARRTIASRFGTLPVAVLLFVLLQAASAPFYPAAPESLHQYGDKFMRTLGAGSC